MSFEKRVVASFCHASSNVCPVLYHHDNAELQKEFSITDDFGNTIYMSEEQLQGFIEKAKAGEISL